MDKARPHLAALAAYVLLAVAFTWPLAASLSTHLTGPIDGDTGVYVWNQWVFRHELIHEGSNPYFTGRILSTTSPENLALHNYTTLANVLALPLMQPLGVVATFNVVYLLMVTLTAYSMFLLARTVTGGGTTAAWLAGALFAFAPTMVARSMGHFSLASAPALPLFVLLLIRVHTTHRLRDAAALGAAAAAAAFTDVYFGVFCVVIGAAYGAVQVVRIHRLDAAAPAGRHIVPLLDILIGCALLLAGAIAVTGGWRVTVADQVVSIRGLYTPMLVATVLLIVRVAWHYRATVRRVATGKLWRSARLAAAAMVIAACVLSPVLYGLAGAARTGPMDDTPVFWRTSPSGVDVAALALPNPNHPLAPASWRAWLTTAAEDSYMENVASLPLVALLVMAVAYARGWRPPRLWIALTIGFVLLALGPFVAVGQVNTYIPGPWAVLRYVPVLGLIRSPGRFMVLVLLATSVLFALALAWTAARSRHRGVIYAAAAVLLLFELLPAPRTLYSAGIPPVYSRIAADPRADIRILELPLGVRDGRSMVGEFTARTQFVQTYHRKPVVGGLLSRLPQRRVDLLREDPIVDALLDLSAGAVLSERLRARLLADGPAFIQRANVGYLVIDRQRTSKELMKVVPAAFDLVLVDSDDDFDVYAPRPAP